MKHFFFSCCFFAVSLLTEAQITINLTMNPRPVASISDWANRRNVLTLIATGGAIGGIRNAKINTTITTTSGEPVATTDMLRAPARTISQGTTIFNAGDVVNLSFMIFNSLYQNKLNKTGKLPAGSYQITVRLDAESLPAAVSNTVSKSFYLAGTQLPVLMLPADESVLKATSAQTSITFRWTAVAPKPVDAVRYKVQVFEVLQNQTPMQALRSNQPLLDKEVLGLTQFIWQPQLSFIEGENKKFIWTIQSFDFLQQLITGETPNNEGRSEAKTFNILTTRTGKPIKN